MKTQDCRIEFKTKTPEEKNLYESKWKELGYSNRSDMIRTAINQLINGSDESSPEVLRLQQELSMEKEQRMELEAKTWNTSNAYKSSQQDVKDRRIETYGTDKDMKA